MKLSNRFFIIYDTVSGPTPPGTGVTLLTLYTILLVSTSPPIILSFSIQIPISNTIYSSLIDVKSISHFPTADTIISAC